MFLADQRPHVGSRVARYAELEFLGTGLEAGDELVEDRAFDIDPLGAQTNLAAVGKAGTNRRFDGDIHVAVGKDDARILAAHFERHRT